VSAVSGGARCLVLICLLRVDPALRPASDRLDAQPVCICNFAPIVVLETAVEEIGTNLFIKAIKEYVKGSLHVPEEEVNSLFVKENTDALRAQLDYDNNGKVWFVFMASYWLCVGRLVSSS
jgi:hypothetical protein